MSVCLVTLALSFSVYNTTDSHYYTVHVVHDILSVCVCVDFCVFYFEVHMSLWSGCSFVKIS